MENNEVRFEVLKIERANKPGHVVVTLKFKNSEKLFTYVRKMYVQSKWYRYCGNRWMPCELYAV